MLLFYIIASQFLASTRMEDVMRTLNILIIILSFTTSIYAQSPEKKPGAYRATVNEKGVQKIEMIGGNYYFNPDHVIVKKNIPVELIIKKEPGLAPHNIVINEPEAGIDIRESIGTKEKTIQFTPVKAGKYLFICDKKLLFFKSHREKGMKGILEVTD